MIGSGKIHLVLQFEPNPAVGPEAISTLENHPLKPEVGNLRTIMSEGISILWRHQILQLVPEKKTHSD